MHQQSPPPAAAMQLQHGASGSFAELSAFMKEVLERDDRAKQEMLERDDRAKQEMEAKVEQAKREARADMDQLREQMTPPEEYVFACTAQATDGVVSERGARGRGAELSTLTHHPAWVVPASSLGRLCQHVAAPPPGAFASPAWVAFFLQGRSPASH